MGNFSGNFDSRGGAMMFFAAIGAIVFLGVVILQTVSIFELAKDHKALADRLEKVETTLKRYEDDLK